MGTIVVTKPDRTQIHCTYLEQLAERLAKIHGRQINIAEELEGQIDDVEGCYFYIDNVKYHYQQFEED